MNATQFGCYHDRRYNIGYLKRYSDSRYKLVHMKSVRIAGLEERKPRKVSRSPPDAEAGKLSNSLSRSRSAVWELAFCNPWEYFCTLTIDGTKHDRYDLSATYSALAKWVNNLNSRTDANIRYLLVPDPHKDKAWHFHGLIYGLPQLHLTNFTLEDYIPPRLRSMLLEGRQLFNWPAYAQRFGFATLEPIRDIERCAGYITKYITKELFHSSIQLNHHLYYCSHGLKRGETIYSGEMRRQIESPDFANEYVRIKTLSSMDEALPYFCDLEE